MNEKIKIFDVDSNRELGTLQITDAIILIDEPFTIKERKEYDDNGESGTADDTSGAGSDETSSPRSGQALCPGAGAVCEQAGREPEI